MSDISETYNETYKKLLQSFGTSSKEVKSCEPIVVEVSHLFHHDIGTDSIKYWGSCFVTRCDINLLQNASGFSFSFSSFLLCGKIRQLLQNVKILLQNVTFITKSMDTSAKPRKMWRLPWDPESNSETMWHMVKPWDMRGLKPTSE